MEVLLGVPLDELPVGFGIPAEDLAELESSLGDDAEDSPSPVPTASVPATVAPAFSARAVLPELLPVASLNGLLDLNEVVRVLEFGFALLAEVEVGTFVALIPDAGQGGLSATVAGDVSMNDSFGGDRGLLDLFALKLDLNFVDDAG